MDRKIESSSFGTGSKIARVVALAVLSLGLFPLSAFAETCMTDSLMMIDETVEVKSSHPIKQVKSHRKQTRLVAGSSAKLGPARQATSAPMDVSGTKISQVQTQEGSR